MKRLSNPSLALLIFAVLVASPLAAADKNATIDPKQADADFAIQGEYVGQVTTDKGEKTLGAQVIALGDGKFRAVGFVGGLPGDKDARKTGEAIEAAAENGSVIFKGKYAVGTIKDGVMEIANLNGKKIGQLKRVERKSPTLGAKPPQGAVVLFDGTSADNFSPGKISDDALLEQGANSKQKFQGQTLHVEFLLPFMPKARGQGRGNSGVYLQGRYEVQVLDSFGLEGKNNECGGIYSIKDPDLNMCYPPLEWQTYDVDFTPARFDDAGKKTDNARMTVRHNGVVVHDNVEVPKTTTAAPNKEGPEPGFLHLQNHGNPVRYRNIWVVPKK